MKHKPNTIAKRFALAMTLPLLSLIALFMLGMGMLMLGHYELKLLQNSAFTATELRDKLIPLLNFMQWEAILMMSLGFIGTIICVSYYVWRNQQRLEHIINQISQLTPQPAKLKLQSITKPLEFIESALTELDTHIQQQNENIARSQYILNESTNLSPTLIGYIDEHNCFTWCNAACSVLTNKSQDSLQNAHLSHVFGENFYNEIKNILTETREFGQPRQKELNYLRNNDQRRLEVTLTPDLEGHHNLNGIFFNANDMTTIYQQNTRQESLIKHSPSPFIICDQQSGKLLWLNRAAQNLMSEWSNNEYPASLQDYFPDDTTRDAISRSITKMKAKTDIQTTTLKLNSTHKKPLYLHVMMQSDEEQIYMSMHRMESRQIITNQPGFLSQMTHQIRTPLNGIVGMLDLLSDANLTMEQQAQLVAAQHSSQALLNTINEAIDYSQLESGQLKLNPTPTDINTELQQCLQSIRSKAFTKKLELAIDVQPNIPPLMLDEKRFKQIINGLVHSTLNSLDNGGIALENNYHLGQLHINLTIHGSNIQMQYFNIAPNADQKSDDNTAPVNIEFNIAQELIMLMGGELTIQRQPNQDYILKASIPCEISPKDAHKAKEQDPINTKALANKRVLVVDDHDFNRHIFLKHLQRVEARVTTAANANQAKLRIQQAQKQNDPFDLILLDHNMPDQNGPELAVELSENPDFKLPPCILVSSEDITKLAAQPQNGIVAIAQKPIPADELYQTMCQALKKQTTTSQNQVQKTDKDATTMTQTHQLTILAAEDNPVNQMFLQALLDKLGHNSTIVGNGQEALDALAKQPYDIILMDVQMPEMNGIEATKAIRALATDSAKTPIIAVTASAMPGDREKFLGAGMDGYISKPIDRNALDQMLQRYGHKQRQQKSA